MITRVNPNGSRYLHSFTLFFMQSKSTINQELFMVFLRIGGFTIGGGMAMVPMMEKEIVVRKQWLTKEEFLDIMAVSQATPGIFAIDMASHIGYKISGLRGAIMAALGNIVPSLVIILLIATFFRAFKDNYWVEAIFKGIRPAVVALITLPVFSMARSAKLTRRNIWIPVLAAILIWLFGVSPMWIILSAGIGGYLYGRRKKHVADEALSDNNTPSQS